MTKRLKTKSFFVLACILAGLLFHAPLVCRAWYVEKFEPVWEQKRPELKPARLFVETTPGNAQVRILNIQPVFSQGMALEPGRYHLEVSAEGFNTEKRWVSLSAGEDGKINIRLTAVRVERPNPVVTRPTVEQKERNSLGMKFVYIPPGSFMMGSGISPSEVVSRYSGKEEWYKDEHPLAATIRGNRPVKNGWTTGRCFLPMTSPFL